MLSRLEFPPSLPDLSHNFGKTMWQKLELQFLEPLLGKPIGKQQVSTLASRSEVSLKWIQALSCLATLRRGCVRAVARTTALLEKAVPRLRGCLFSRAWVTTRRWFPIWGVV